MCSKVEQNNSFITPGTIRIVLGMAFAVFLNCIVFAYAQLLSSLTSCRSSDYNVTCVLCLYVPMYTAGAAGAVSPLSRWR